MCVCTKPHDDSMIYTRRAAGALRSDIAHPSTCLPSLFTMPKDAIEPSIFSPQSNHCPITADPPSLTVSNYIKFAFSNLTTRAHPTTSTVTNLSRTRSPSGRHIRT